ncbi:hypothetical protein QE357_003710 [Siphonobacter sp. BAB-5404]|nr:hypothetical protein [Siphonobacter sp. SORGH_AS_0500]
MKRSLLCGLALLGLGLGKVEAQSKKKAPEASVNLLIPAKKLESLKQELLVEIDKMKDFSAEMNDMVFSFGELGFQEHETSKYLTGILEKNGFTIQRGIGGIPTAWTATWGTGKPKIAVGSDIDCIPKASQKPGVAYHDPIIEGAPEVMEKGITRVIP